MTDKRQTEVACLNKNFLPGVLIHFTYGVKKILIHQPTLYMLPKNFSFRGKAVVTQWIAKAPRDLRGPFGCWFELRHQRLGLAEGLKT
ncbi:hypothetical protein PoB_003405800 [Plakobranchus ocellatus]|uniref:Uncharacterized protein n=1 Tax=Plakobranchus ocellatus TaxID=259542 RepID=A0AAV4AJT4_9GAST|nr:hypothetical protein PoB_003405800 [Plakobranchus ocellatus]